MSAGALLDDDLRAATECRITTTGRTSGRPREVRVWFAAVEDRLYLLSQDQGQAHWVRNLRSDPRVRVSIGSRSFQGRGRVVDGGVDDTAAREALAAKYGTRWLTKWLRESLAVRIDVEREVM